MSISKYFKAQYFPDILFNISAAQQFVAGMSYDEFCDDLKTRYVTERALQNIGEAVIQLEKNMRAEVDPEFSLAVLDDTIPWRNIKGMSNILRHDYDDIDIKIIWHVVQERLPTLKTVVGQALADATEG